MRVMDQTYPSTPVTDCSYPSTRRDRRTAAMAQRHHTVRYKGVLKEHVPPRNAHQFEEIKLNLSLSG